MNEREQTIEAAREALHAGAFDWCVAARGVAALEDTGDFDAQSAALARRDAAESAMLGAFDVLESTPPYDTEPA